MDKISDFSEAITALENDETDYEYQLLSEKISEVVKMLPSDLEILSEALLWVGC